MGTAALIMSIIGAVVGIGTLVGSSIQNKQQMDQNKEIATQQIETAKEGKAIDQQLNQQNIEMQKQINDANIANQNQQNAIMRAREDNAIQRRADDLQAAGINPMLAGLQGASAQPGQLAIQQAPIADTSIGSRYATNITNLLDSLGAREQERRRQFSENMRETGNQATAISGQLNNIAKTKSEMKLMEAQYKNLNADTKKKFEEIVKIQKEVEEKTVSIGRTKEETKYIKEMITSEPLKRALITAQTKEHYQNIKTFQQRILNMKEERIHEIIKQTETLEKIAISKEAQRKIQREVENLIIDGDIKEFGRKMLVLDKTTSVSKEYIQMFTNIFTSIWGK